MIWHFIYLVGHLLWDCFRFSRLASDDKTIELLILRQQLLIMRRHQKRGPTITRTENLMLLTLIERFQPIIELPKAQLEQLILIFKPDTCRVEKPHLTLPMTSNGREEYAMLLYRYPAFQA